MKPIAPLCIILLCVLPVKGLAKGWHLAHGQDPETGNGYYVAQMKDIPVRVLEHKVWTNNRIKTRMTMMFSCSIDRPTLKAILFFDEIPKFSTNRRRDGSLDYYPVLLSLHSKKKKEPQLLETEVSHMWSMPNGDKGLGIDRDVIIPILQHDRISIGFMSKWNGDALMAKVSLKGALAVVNKALRYCDGFSE